MGKKVDYTLVYRISKAYYLDKKTQQEIADVENFSRPQISRLLKKALEDELVTYTLNFPNALDEQMLSRQLREQLKLEQAALDAASKEDAEEEPADEDTAQPEAAAPVDLSQQELAAYRRAEQAERNAMVRARKLREQLSLLCEQSKDRYTDAGEEISALTSDLSSGLSRLQETLADIQAIFDDAESAFDELQLPGEDDV